MRIAYFSPLGPQRSGIADYSEELLPHLAAAGAEIELFVDGFRPSNESLLSRFRWHDYQSQPGALDRLDNFDAAVYHMGSDHRHHAGIYAAARRRPGILVLHDHNLQNFFAGVARESGDWYVYLDEVKFCHGDAVRAGAEQALALGVPLWAAGDFAALPLSYRLAGEAEGVIVHSEWSRSRLANTAPQTPARRVNHHVLPAAPAKRARDNGGDGPRRVEIVTFLGRAAGEKGVEQTLNALASLRARRDFHYTLIGELGSFDVRAIAQAANLSDRVTVTGYVSREEFQCRVAEADIAVNLCEPAAGDTSKSVFRAMAAGVSVVASNVGWFAELPDDAVIKIDAGADTALLAQLDRLIGDETLRRRTGEAARRHIHTAHSISQSAAAYLDFISETVRRRPRRQLIRRVAAELIALGVRPENDILRGVAAEVARIVPSGEL